MCKGAKLWAEECVRCSWVVGTEKADEVPTQTASKTSIGLVALGNILKPISVGECGYRSYDQVGSSCKRRVVAARDASCDDYDVGSRHEVEVQVELCGSEK